MGTQWDHCRTQQKTGNMVRYMCGTKRDPEWQWDPFGAHQGARGAVEIHRGHNKCQRGQ